jgi:hypothetical protein
MFTLDLHSLASHSEQQYQERIRQERDNIALLREQHFQQMQRPFIDKVINAVMYKSPLIKKQAETVSSPKERAFFHLKDKDDQELYQRTKGILIERVKALFGPSCSIHCGSKEYQEWTREQRYNAKDYDSCNLYLNYKPYLYITWDGIDRPDQPLKKRQNCGYFTRNPGYISD